MGRHASGATRRARREQAARVIQSYTTAWERGDSVKMRKGRNKHWNELEIELETAISTVLIQPKYVEWRDELQNMVKLHSDKVAGSKRDKAEVRHIPLTPGYTEKRHIEGNRELRNSQRGDGILHRKGGRGATTPDRCETDDVAKYWEGMNRDARKTVVLG